jgi:hypothetical protein
MHMRREIVRMGREGEWEKELTPKCNGFGCMRNKHRRTKRKDVHVRKRWKL